MENCPVLISNSAFITRYSLISSIGDLPVKDFILLYIVVLPNLRWTARSLTVNSVSCIDVYKRQILLVLHHDIACYNYTQYIKCSFLPAAFQFFPELPVHRHSSWNFQDYSCFRPISAGMPMNRKFEKIWKNGKSIFSEIVGVGYSIKSILPFGCLLYTSRCV